MICRSQYDVFEQFKYALLCAKSVLQLSLLLKNKKQSPKLLFNHGYEITIALQIPF